jgi:hypothetical protein
MAPRPSPDLSSSSDITNMFKNDSGAIGINAHQMCDVIEFFLS